MLPYLDNLNLPFADDSNAVTPTSEELYYIDGSTRHVAVANGMRRRVSTASHVSRYSRTSTLLHRAQLQQQQQQQQQQLAIGSRPQSPLPRQRVAEPTHFQYLPSLKSRQQPPCVFDGVGDKSSPYKHIDGVSMRSNMI